MTDGRSLSFYWASKPTCVMIFSYCYFFNNKSNFDFCSHSPLNFQGEELKQCCTGKLVLMLEKTVEPVNEKEGSHSGINSTDPDSWEV